MRRVGNGMDSDGDYLKQAGTSGLIKGMLDE